MDNLERTDFLFARNLIDMVQEYYTEERLITITHDDLLLEAEEVAVNQYDETTGEITNDLTIGEYNIVITSTPYRATLEDSQFEQAVSMREAGVDIPDDVLIENSRLQRKSEISKRLQNEKNGPEAQAAAALKVRANEAEVASMEADAINKRADADLKAAKTKQAIAAIAQEDARIEIEAEKAASSGDSPEKAQQEMALEGQKADHKMTLEERQFQHKQSLAEREMAMKERTHENDEARAADMHEHQKQISTKQAEAQALAAEAGAINAQSSAPKEK
jgi:hypothetical protein